MSLSGVILIDKADNRKVLLMINTFIAALLTLLGSVSISFSMLFVIHVLTGIFIGSLSPTIYSMLSDLFKPGERVRAFNIWSIVSSVGSGIGFGLGLLIGIKYGWRTAMLYGSIPLFIAILIIFLIKEPLRAASEDELTDLILDSGVRYTYRISRKDLKFILKNKTTLFLIIQSIFVYIAWGSFSTWALHAISRELGTTIIIATIILALASIGNLGAFILAPIADRMRVINPRYKTLMAALCILSEAIFLSLMMLSLPVINIYDTNVTNAVIGVLEKVSENKTLAIAILFGFIGLFAGSILGPIRDSTLADVNLPEHRATAISLISIASLVGRSLGIILTGAFSTFFLSLRTAIVFSQMFLIPAAGMWVYLSIFYISELKLMKEILEERKKALESYVEKSKKFLKSS